MSNKKTVMQSNMETTASRGKVVSTRGILTSHLLKLVISAGISGTIN